MEKKHYIGRSLGWGGCIDSIQHTEELWHKLSIEVSDERHVDVYLGKRFVASFSSHFTTKGRGGPMLLSGNHQSTFRNFNIKGTGCKYLIFHICDFFGTCNIIWYLIILRNPKFTYNELYFTDARTLLSRKLEEEYTADIGLGKGAVITCVRNIIDHQWQMSLY